MVSTLEQMQVPNGTGPGVRRSKRPLISLVSIRRIIYIFLNVCPFNWMLWLVGRLNARKPV